MRYDVSLKMKDHRGRNMAIEADAEGKPKGEAELRNVIELLCIAPAASDVAKSVDEKLKLYRILQRTIAAKPILELEAGEVDLLKRVAAVLYPALMLGVLYDTLEAPLAEPRPTEPTGK